MTVQTTVTDGGLQDLGTKAVLYQHPVYTVWAPIWRKLAHVREGAGGFLDGTYLVAHPREWTDYQAENPRTPSKKLLARRRLASYENIAATIIEAKKASLFQEEANRRVGPDDVDKQPSEIEDWWQDVDGSGTSIDDFMADAWDAAATFGHAVIYLDKPGDTGPDENLTAADVDRPYLRVYTPLDVFDWLKDDRGRLTAMKLVEAVARTSFTQLPASTQFQVRLVTDTGWSLYGPYIDGGRGATKGNANGQFIDSGDHNVGALPIVVLYGQRRTMLPDIGHSVLDDPQLYIDLYNLTSEVRELLRNQTFAQMSVKLGPDESVLDAQKNLSQTTGTESALFSHGGIDLIEPSGQAVVAYHNEIERRLRTIYRTAALQWEADTKDAEAKGSLQLKRADMNQRLSAHAEELQRAEYAIAKLWYRAQYGADVGESKFETDQITIQYPESFDLTPFVVMIEQAQAALSLGMPDDVMKEIRKSLVPKLLPELTPDKLGDMMQAIDDEPDPATVAAQAMSVNKALMAEPIGVPKPGSKQEQQAA